MTRIGERTAVMHSRKSPIIIVLALVAVLLACTAFIILLVSNSADKTGTLSGNVVDASDSTCLKGVTVLRSIRTGNIIPVLRIPIRPVTTGAFIWSFRQMIILFYLRPTGLRLLNLQRLIL